MSYSYQAYPQEMTGVYYSEQYPQRKRGSGILGTAIGGAVVGAGASATVTAFQNPYINKKGEVNDEFVKRVCENTLKNASEETKKYYEQNKNILKNIDKVKTVDDLKKLLKENDFFFNKHLSEINHSSEKELFKEEYLKGITENSLKDYKEHFKLLTSNKETEALSHHRIEIERCWDKEAKKFVQAEGVGDNIFKSIQSSKTGMKLKNVSKSLLKGAGIGCGIALILGGVLKILQNRNRQA